MPRRHVIVTGGSGGIGAATAKAFADNGDRVTIMARNTRTLDEVAKEIGARAVRVDVSDPASVEAAFMDAGPADVLVNCAGVARSEKLVSTNVRVWEEILRVNLTGAYLCALKVLPYMGRKGKGRIINVASICGLRGYRYMVAYCASKHGLVGFTRSLADEVGSQGITVNAVCPGWVDTSMTDESIALASERTGMSPEDVRAAMLLHNPGGVLIKPETVAQKIFELATDDAGDVNGQTFPIPEDI